MPKVTPELTSELTLAPAPELIPAPILVQNPKSTLVPTPEPTSEPTPASTPETSPELTLALMPKPSWGKSGRWHMLCHHHVVLNVIIFIITISSLILKLYWT